MDSPALSTRSEHRCDVSILIPIYNESENVALLIQQIRDAMDESGYSWECLLVDDGSTDGTSDRLQQCTASDPRFCVITLRRNFGQTAALQAGIDHAQGDYIAMLDGDLQNDPADIPMMLNKLAEGYDLVHGWRRDRQDKLLSRRLPSLLANRLIARVTNFPVQDLGCTLKVMRREIAEELECYGEMHRFITLLAYQRGARCVEVVTRHRPRRFGKTKYGLGRTSRVVLDLLTVKYMLDYFASPMKLFGKLGLIALCVSMISGAATVIMKLGYHFNMTGNPLLLLAAITAIASLQFFSLGLLGEVSARIYYGQGNKRNYAVRWISRAAISDPTTAGRRAA